MGEGRASVSLRSSGKKTWEPHPFSRNLEGLVITAIALDPSGGLWFGTRGEGIRAFVDGKWRSITTSDGLPSDTIPVVTITKAGEVWAGTTAGIGLLRNYRGTEWEVFSERDALPRDGVSAIVPMSDGSVWVVTRAGAARYSETGWIHHAGPFAEARGRVSVELSLDGDLWASTDRGLFSFAKEEWRLSYAFERPMPVFDLAAGLDGSMWALTPRSILRQTNGSCRPRTYRVRRWIREADFARFRRGERGDAGSAAGRVFTALTDNRSVGWISISMVLFANCLNSPMGRFGSVGCGIFIGIATVT